MLTFLQYVLLASLSKIRCNVGVLTYTWVLNSTSLLTVSVFMSVPCWLYCWSFVVLTQFRMVLPPVVTYCCPWLLWLSWVFSLPIWKYRFFPISMNNCIGDLKGIVLSLCTAFGRMDIFTILILPIHEHERYFHPLVTSFFISLLSFSLYQFFSRLD